MYSEILNTAQDKALADAENRRLVPKDWPLSEEVLDVEAPECCYSDILKQAGLKEINPNAPMYQELRDKILEWY